MRIVTTPCKLLIPLLMLGLGCRFQPAAPANPNVAPVRGRVTLNGKPLPKAEVKFESLSSRASHGMTDADGRYEMAYDQFTKGAFLGSHRIRITMHFMPMDSVRPKPLPERYNKKTELKVQVRPGDNVFNFDLTDESAEANPADTNPLNPAQSPSLPDVPAE